MGTVACLLGCAHREGEHECRAAPGPVPNPRSLLTASKPGKASQPRGGVTACAPWVPHTSEYSGWITFRIDWLDLLAVQGTLKSLLQADRC